MQEEGNNSICSDALLAEVIKLPKRPNGGNNIGSDNPDAVKKFSCLNREKREISYLRNGSPRVSGM